MPIFRNDTFRIQRELRALRAQLAAVTAERDALDRSLSRAHHELDEARKAQPANLTEVTRHLKAFMPTLPVAPGYNHLTAAPDALAYAQALNLLMLHARSVGHAEARRVRLAPAPTPKPAPSAPAELAAAIAYAQPTGATYVPGALPRRRS